MLCNCAQLFEEIREIQFAQCGGKRAPNVEVGVWRNCVWLFGKIWVSRHGGFANVNVSLTFFLSTSMFLNRTLNSISQMLSLEPENILHGRSCGEP